MTRNLVTFHLVAWHHIPNLQVCLHWTAKIKVAEYCADLSVWVCVQLWENQAEYRRVLLKKYSELQK